MNARQLVPVPIGTSWNHSRIRYHLPAHRVVFRYSQNIIQPQDAIPTCARK